MKISVGEDREQGVGQWYACVYMYICIYSRQAVIIREWRPNYFLSDGKKTVLLCMAYVYVYNNTLSAQNHVGISCHVDTGHRPTATAPHRRNACASSAPSRQSQQHNLPCNHLALVHTCTCSRLIITLSEFLTVDRCRKINIYIINNIYSASLLYFYVDRRLVLLL